MEKYFREISEVKLLSPEEEIELAKRIKQNDQKALNKLVLLQPYREDWVADTEAAGWPNARQIMEEFQKMCREWEE